ncbi:MULTISPECIES: hypothetical protein [Massilia]|jgi:hypothetical protein|uniref:Uncharacterized protein n=2 Tax=Massilia TaxID=149698 RepID=A0A7X3FUS0_9BURK|nr:MULTISPECIES: hypothetical protein [Telluria group]KQY08693.1 hypothetical protein ASD28_29310 [Massilia sp. Root133]KQZ54289.1 hypothetical protein ASD92_00050 [Massilia sp. Root1485]MDN4046083.1 hypothetical protein [Massilia sp. YIM B02787]MVW58365.1 hypothetical protein [Telluria cellulosilytica]
MTSPPPFYCISHKDPGWPLPPFLTLVGTGGYVPERGIGMSVYAPQLAYKNMKLGEYAALFMIRRLLEEAHADGFVGVCHYRRYALVAEIGQLRGFNYHAHPSELQDLPIEAFIGDGTTPIISAPINFPGSVMQQYSANAVGRDLLMFFGDAVDCGVIDSDEAINFLSGTSFITAGNVGYMPVAWFVETMRQLEGVVARFAHNHYIRREGYEERTMGLCCERLHGLLLRKKALEYGADKVITRPLTVLTETGRLN